MQSMFFEILSYKNNKHVVMGGIYWPPVTDITCFIDILTNTFKHKIEEN